MVCINMDMKFNNNHLFQHILLPIMARQMRSAFTLLLLLTMYYAYAQTTPYIPSVTKGFIAHGTKKKVQLVKDADTLIGNKEPRYFYISVSTDAFVNTIGNFGKRFSPSVEFGRTYGIFDIGVAGGRLNSLRDGIDTTYFLEVRPTINIFSKGRFSEALCLGGGYVFNAQQSFMTEICNSINFNISETVSLSVLQGYYFFDGAASNHSAQYMGLNITYNLLKKNSVNKQRKRDAIINDN
jgi:hypothetical protein